VNKVSLVSFYDFDGKSITICDEGWTLGGVLAILTVSDWRGGTVTDISKLVV
jgi:hypothetical protein